MVEEDLAEAAHLFGKLWVGERRQGLDEHERESMIEPVKFETNNTDNVWKFGDEIAVNRSRTHTHTHTQRKTNRGRIAET